MSPSDIFLSDFHQCPCLLPLVAASKWHPAPQINPLFFLTRLSRSESICRGKMAHLSCSSSSISWSQLPAPSSTQAAHQMPHIATGPSAGRCTQTKDIILNILYSAFILQTWQWAGLYLILLPNSINEPQPYIKSLSCFDNFMLMSSGLCPRHKLVVLFGSTFMQVWVTSNVSC